MVVERKRDEYYTIFDMEMEDFVLSATYLNPHKSTVGHQHPWSEAYYIAIGFGKIIIGREIKDATEGDFIRIPANIFHQVFNLGTFPMRFVCAWREK